MWGMGKSGGRCGKMWGSVLGCGGRCVENGGGVEKCGEVCWGVGEVRKDMGRGVGGSMGMWEEVRGVWGNEEKGVGVWENVGRGVEK